MIPALWEYAQARCAELLERARAAEADAAAWKQGVEDANRISQRERARAEEAEAALAEAERRCALLEDALHADRRAQEDQPARGVRLPPPSDLPPMRAVAENVRVLDEWFPGVAALLALRAFPEVADWLKRWDAEGRYRAYRAAGYGSVESRHRAARRVGVHERTLRRWGLVD